MTDYTKDFLLMKIQFLKELESDIEKNLPLTEDLLLEYQIKFLEVFIGCEDSSPFQRFTHNVAPNWSFSFMSYTVNEGISGTLHALSPLHGIKPILPTLGSPGAWFTLQESHVAETPEVGDIVIVKDSETKEIQIEGIISRELGRKYTALGGMFTKRGSLSGKGVYSYPRDYKTKYEYKIIDMRKLYRDFLEDLCNASPT